MVKNKIIIGTWPLSGDFGKVSPSEVEKVITGCVHSGFKSFDTAPSYGAGFSEASLGLIFDGDRSVKFYTKCGNVIDYGKTLQTDFLEKSLHGSLKRLRTDTLAGLYLHNPRGSVVELNDSVRWLKSLPKHHNINEIGISAARKYDYQQHVPELDLFQLDCNLLCLQDFQRFKDIRPEKVKVVARSPVAAGVLYNRFKHRDENDHRKNWLFGERAKFLAECVKAIECLLPSGMTAAEASVRYLLHHDQIDHIVYGIRSLNHLEQLCNLVEEGPLDRRLQYDLEQLEFENFGFTNLEHLRF